MSSWARLRFVPLALIQVLFWPLVLCAQLPEPLERCLPYPTLAQEIRTMKEETESAQARMSEIKRTIVSVKFGPETHLPQSVRSRIVRSIKYRQFYDDSESDWLNEVQEVGLKGQLQDLGYFRAKVEAVAHLIDGGLHRQRYWLTLRIEEGWQYRLAEIHFENALEDEPLAFSASELREHIHLRRGELLIVSRIRAGIEEISKLYATKGYVDMTMEPEFKNDDDGGPMDLVMKINEEKQYRVGKIEFLGLNEETQLQLKSNLKPGNVFNETFIDEIKDEIFKRRKSLLPADASWKDVSIVRNFNEGTVDIRFYFYSCPRFED